MILERLKNIISKRKAEKVPTRTTVAINREKASKTSFRCPDPFCQFNGDTEDDVNIHVLNFHSLRVEKARSAGL